MAVLFPVQQRPSPNEAFAQVVDSLLRRADERRRQQKLRWDILTGDWSESLDAKIKAVHQSPSFAAEVMRFRSVAVNLGKLVTNTLANVYKMGARRRVDGDPRSEDGIRDFYKEAAWDTEAARVNKAAFLEGPMTAVPWISPSQAGRIYTIPAHCAEVVQDPLDPIHGDPLAMGWVVSERPEFRPPGMPVEAAYVYADHEWYIIIDRNGSPMGEMFHGMGMFPGVPFRAYAANADDWWSLDEMLFMADATLLVGYFVARLNMRRKQQDSKVPSIVGPDDAIPSGQALQGGEKPLIFDVGTADQGMIQIEVHDMDLSPENAIRHIRQLAEWCVEQLGVPQSAVTFDIAGKESEALSMNVSHDRLSQLRAEQIPFFRKAERALAAKVAVAMQTFGHPLRFQVSPESVAERFQIEFPELNRAGDPLTVMKLEDWELGHMLIDEVDLVMRKHPELTRSQAEEFFREKLEFRASVAKTLSERDLVLDPSKGLLGTPEVFGRMGGHPRSESNDEVDNDRSE